jgi:ribosome maturation protein SDO1
LDDIILEILKKGELQVGDKERQAQLDRVHAEVIDFVAARMVDPASKRVYTSGIIEKALDQLSSQSHQPQAAAAAASAATPVAGEAGEEKTEVKKLPTWTGVVTTKSAKSQALDAIKALIAHQPIPISRARMRLRITCPSGILKQAAKTAPKGGDEEGETKASGTVKDRILSYVEEVVSQEMNGGDWEVVGFVEPGSFRDLSEFISSHTKGKARAEVLDMAVVHEGDS